MREKYRLLSASKTSGGAVGIHHAPPPRQVTCAWKEQNMAERPGTNNKILSVWAEWWPRNKNALIDQTPPTQSTCMTAVPSLGAPYITIIIILRPKGIISKSSLIVPENRRWPRAAGDLSSFAGGGGGGNRPPNCPPQHSKHLKAFRSTV